jgi:hypothetical protein
MQPDSGLRLVPMLTRQGGNERRPSLGNGQHTCRLLRAASLRADLSAWLGGCKRTSTTQKQCLNRDTYTRLVTPVPSRTKRQNARGMIGVTVQQDVQVGQTRGPCQHSCLRSDDRFRFVAVSQRTQANTLANTMSVSTQCLLLARYAETHFRSCNK